MTLERVMSSLACPDSESSNSATVPYKDSVSTWVCMKQAFANIKGCLCFKPLPTSWGYCLFGKFSHDPSLHPEEKNNIRASWKGQVVIPLSEAWSNKEVFQPLLNGMLVLWTSPPPPPPPPFTFCQIFLTVLWYPCLPCGVVKGIAWTKCLSQVYHTRWLNHGLNKEFLIQYPVC